jgi:hypothetical protein
MKKLAFLLVASAAFGLTHIPAYACVVLREFDINDARNADTIVIGKISNFKMEKSRINSLHGYGIFDVSVQQLITGKSPKNISVIWPETTNTSPQDLSDQNALIALDKTEKSDIIKQGYTPNSKLNTRMIFFQSQCTHAFILNPSAKIVAAVRTALQGDQLASKPEGPLFVEERARSSPKPQKSRGEVIAAALAALLLIGALAAFGLKWLKKSKKT